MDPPTIIVGSATGKPGDAVQIPITMADSPEFAGFEATLTYDAAVLTLTAFENGSLQNATLNPATGRIIGGASDNYKLNGTICTASFKINDGAAYDDYEIGLTVDDLYDVDEDSFEPDVVPGKITVAAAGAGDLTDGYSVFMERDKTVDAGADVNVAVGIAGQGEGFDKYTNYTMEFTYDRDKLTYNGVIGLSEDDEVVASAENGVITVRKYGTEQISSATTGTAFTLQFTAATSGTAAVTCTFAGIGNKGTALAEDEIPATLLDADTVITINTPAPAEYDVTISVGGYTDAVITGAEKAIEGQPYTFSVNDPNYSYTFTASVNEKTVPVTGPGEDGKTYTIAAADVTGPISIELTNRTPKTYTVTVKNGDGETVDPAAVEVALPEGVPTYKTDYVFTVNKAAGFDYDVTVTVGNNTASPTIGEDGKTFTIVGTNVTGDVVITVAKTQAQGVTVNFVGTGASDVEGGDTQSAAVGRDFTFTVNQDTEHYDYTVSAVRGDTTVAMTPGENGEYIIAAAIITAGETPITVTVEKTRNLHLHIIGSEFIKLDGASGVLVRVTAALLPGEVLIMDQFYGGPVSSGILTPMYYTTAPSYKEGFEGSPGGVWVLLAGFNGGSIKNLLDTIVSPTGATLLKPMEGSIEDLTLSYDFNVNQSDGGVDTNDAQFVWNMYNAQYSKDGAEWDENIKRKILSADLNQDMVINVLDASMIVNHIING